MSRYYYNKKEESDDLMKISVWFIKKYGYLRPNIWHQSGTITWTSGWLENKNSVGMSSCTISDDQHSPHIELTYTQTERSTGEKKDFNYKIKLVSTNCRFGGIRWWFVCPLIKRGISCNRRVGVIYKSGDYFGCRHCHELSYQSRNINRDYYARQPIFSYMRDEKIVEDIYEKMKRTHYAGKPTQKMRRIIKIRKRMNQKIPFIL